MQRKRRIRFAFNLSVNRKSKICPELCRRIKNTKWVRLSVMAFALVVSGAVASAQQAKQIPRVGFLNASTFSSVADRLNAFRLGLRELGYVEGKDVVVEFRHAEGQPERLNELAGELVRLKV